MTNKRWVCIVKNNAEVATVQAGGRLVGHHECYFGDSEADARAKAKSAGVNLIEVETSDPLLSDPLSI